MKKSFNSSITCILVMLLFSACVDPVYFDEKDLVGHWIAPSTNAQGVAGQLHFRYRADHSGVEWDTSDDVSEDESTMKFTWSVGVSKPDELVHTYHQELGADIPKYYTLITLDAVKLTYRDNFGKTFSFTRTGD
ncbi:MAG: hypothetical protein LBC89_01640 [Bacteroidales bacterium]|jgi:hypothetical protein|nr:hypothetical protein [Bacteroidales bacterium]